MRHVRRFSFQYYDFVRQCHAFDLAWRHFDHLPLLKFAHFAHFPNLSLDTPASLESSSSVWIGSAFSEICKSWGLIPPVDRCLLLFRLCLDHVFHFQCQFGTHLIFRYKTDLGVFILLISWYLREFLHSFQGFLLAFGLSICFRLFKTTIKWRCIFEVLRIHTLRLTRSSDLRNADRHNIHQNSYNTTLCPQT